MRFISLAVLPLIACGSSQALRPAQESRPACPTAQYWNGSACADRANTENLERAASALEAFDVETSLSLLAKARATGPHSYREHVRLYEQLGIAHSYLADEAAALRAFEMLLTLAPGHLLSYTLSPKATFLFERARLESSDRAVPELDLSWPRNLDVRDGVPVEIEVVADPKDLLHHATLHIRKRGDADYRSVDVELAEPGAFTTAELPPLDSSKPEVLELYVTAFDARNNETLLWAEKEKPREISLGFEEPIPWYSKWWVWAAVGGFVAVTTGATVYAISREPPDSVVGVFGVVR